MKVPRPNVVGFVICAIAVVSGVASAQTRLQKPISNPDLIAGPWETTDDSGIDGVWITLLTAHPANPKTIRQWVSVLVYHRGKAEQTWTYVSPPADFLSYSSSASLQDGKFLRIRIAGDASIKPVEINLIFSTNDENWTGTWWAGRSARRVDLRRPRPGDERAKSVIGDWNGGAERGGSFHIRASSDDALSAWLDSSVYDVRSSGELVAVESDTKNNIRLQLVDWPCSYEGNLSEDDEVLTGDWEPLEGRTVRPACSEMYPAILTRRR